MKVLTYAFLYVYIYIYIYIKYILYIDFKFGILNLKIFMIIMILYKHCQFWTNYWNTREAGYNM